MSHTPKPKKARRRRPADPKKRGLPLGSPCAHPCPDCGAMLVLRRGRFDLFYGCERYPACRGSHGAHPDGRPLGIPADAATRKARNDAHGYFDRLWREQPTGRAKAVGAFVIDCARQTRKTRKPSSAGPRIGVVVEVVGDVKRIVWGAGSRTSTLRQGRHGRIYPTPQDLRGRARFEGLAVYEPTAEERERLLERARAEGYLREEGRAA